MNNKKINFSVHFQQFDDSVKKRHSLDGKYVLRSDHSPSFQSYSPDLKVSKKNQPNLVDNYKRSSSTRKPFSLPVHGDYKFYDSNVEVAKASHNHVKNNFNQFIDRDQNNKRFV